MTELRNYPYSSVLAPFIEGFIIEKRNLGFIYNSEAYELFRLDTYWNENEFTDWESYLKEKNLNPFYVTGESCSIGGKGC